jgi:hypothetical protein
MTARRLIGVVLTAVLATTAVAGCGGDGKKAAKPAAVSTPGVQTDGSYRLGTLPDKDASAALKAAVTALPVAVSYDYRTLDDSLAKATALMTASFAKEFTKTFDASTRAMAVQKQAITSALVRGAGVIGAVKGGKVTCLVYLDQVLVSSKDKKASSPLKVSQNSVRVKLQKVGGAWKVDDVEPF